MRVVTPEGAQRLDAALNAAGAPWQRLDVAVAAGKATITACGPTDSPSKCSSAVLTLTEGPPSLVWAPEPPAPSAWQQVAAARLAGFSVGELSAEVGASDRTGEDAGSSPQTDRMAESLTRAPQGYVIEAPQRRAAPAEQGPMRPADAIGPIQAVGLAILVAAAASLVAWRWRSRRAGGVGADRSARGDSSDATSRAGAAAWAETATAQPTWAAALVDGARWRVAALSFGTFVAASLGVYHLYPFYVFDMYSDVYDDANRIIAVDASGAAHELDAYAVLRCEGAPDAAWLAPPGCPETQRYAVRDRYAAGALRARATSGDAGAAPLEPVVIARRIWRLGPDGVSALDCPLQRCQGLREAR